MIDKSKDTYQKYRDRARDLYERGAVSHGDKFGTNVVLDSVDIPHHAHVLIVDDGAYVEAFVWVPRDKLERPAQPIADPEQLSLIDDDADQHQYDANNRADG